MSTAVTGTLDTSGVQGGENSHAEDDPTQYLDGTLSTLEPGSPTRNADPAYAPPPGDVPGTVVDTTHTDQPTTSGEEITDTPANMSENLDTINFDPAMRTTTDNTPATPGSAPTVAALDSAARVTIVALAEPAGAPINAYRVEAARVATSGDAPGENTAPGVDWIETGQTEVVMRNLTPGDLYKFRFAGVNDNGTGDFSPWSSAVTPTLQEKPLFSHMTYADTAQPVSIADPAGRDPANVVNPVYKPDGTVLAGTGPSVGAVGLAWVGKSGDAWDLVVTWTASPLVTTEVDDYDVVAKVGGVTLGAAATGVDALTTTISNAKTGVQDPDDLPTTVDVTITANGPDTTTTTAVTPVFGVGSAARSIAAAWTLRTGTLYNLTLTWLAPSVGTAPTSYDVDVTGTAAPLSTDAVAALTKVYVDAANAASVGLLPTSLVVSIAANPSGALAVATVTPTHP